MTRPARTAAPIPSAIVPSLVARSLPDNFRADWTDRTAPYLQLLRVGLRLQVVLQARRARGPGGAAVDGCETRTLRGDVRCVLPVVQRASEVEDREQDEKQNRRD